VFAVPQVKHNPLLKITTLSTILHGEHLPIPLDIVQTAEFAQAQPPFPSLRPVEEAGHAKHVEFVVYEIVVLHVQIPPVALLTQ